MGKPSIFSIVTRLIAEVTLMLFLLLVDNALNMPENKVEWLFAFSLNNN